MDRQLLTTMEHDVALRALEHAERETPVCRLCGERTVPVGRADGSVWLECTSLAELADRSGDRRPSWRRRLGLELGAHTHQLVIEARAAA